MEEHLDSIKTVLYIILRAAAAAAIVISQHFQVTYGRSPTTVRIVTISFLNSILKLFQPRNLQ